MNDIDLGMRGDAPHFHLFPRDISGRRSFYFARVSLHFDDKDDICLSLLFQS